MIKTVATGMKKGLRLETDGLDSIAFHLPTFETKQTLFRRCVIPLHEECTHGMRKERRKSRNDQIACLDKGTVMFSPSQQRGLYIDASVVVLDQTGEIKSSASISTYVCKFAMRRITEF